MAIGTLGIFFPILYIFFPMLFLTEALEQGMFKILLAYVGVCLVIGAISPILGFGIFTLFGPLILILHYCITSKQGILETVAASTGVLFAGVLVLLHTTGLVNLLRNPGFPAQFVEMQKVVFKDLGASQEVLTNFETNFSVIFQRMIELLPSLLVVVSLLISYVTFRFTGKNLLKKGKLIGQPPSFLFFSLPSGLLPISFGLLLLNMIPAPGYEGVRELMLNNATILFGFLFFIQGLSLFSFFGTKYKMHPMMKWVGLVLIMMTPGIQAPVAIMGMVDYVFNFRKIQRF